MFLLGINKNLETVENKISELHILLLITLTGIEVITETDLAHSTYR
jgi:hypothetical protein